MGWQLIDQAQVRTLAVGTAGIFAFAALLPALHAYGSVSLPFFADAGPSASASSVIVLERGQETSRDLAEPSLDDVTSQSQLVLYARGLMRANPSISRITIATSSISMTYRSQEHVLHFGTRMLERTLAVSSDGDVTLVLPWYATMFGDEDDPAMGFSDIDIEAGKDGMEPQTAARILTRMLGRFQIGAA